MAKLKDISGEKFYKLTVISRAPDYVAPSGRKIVQWNCVCDCGNSMATSGYNLRSGRVKSCGCLQKENRTKTENHYTKHKMSYEKIYKVWQNAKNRCICETAQAYENYGGRGIKMCEEWSNSFEQFYEHVSRLPHFGESGYSLDRINNDGNYEPGNVRWATKKEQANNQRKKRKRRKNGEK